MLHRAVAVEMIRRQIDQDADRWGRATARDRSDRTSTRSHGRGLACGGSSDRIAVPILPPICASLPGVAQQMCDQRRGRRFAVGAGDGDERRCRARDARVRGRTARCRRSPRLPPRAQAPPTNAAPDASAARRASAPAPRCSTSRSGANRRCGSRPARLRAILLGIVVPGDDFGAAGAQGVAARQAGAAETEDRDRFTGEGRDRDHDRVPSPQLQRR